jgi:anaerobic nitric oxide reductase transcription regulator
VREPDATVTYGRSLREAVDEFQRRMIRQALADQRGNWAAAARVLGMHRSNLFHMARRLGMNEQES